MAEVVVTIRRYNFEDHADLEGVVVEESSTITVLTEDPDDPAENQAWIVIEGVSPAATMSLKAFYDGETHVLASVGF